ncbi:hypothetical protein TNCV_3445871 [Trichonephila clavipes]|nr:hypothetical protein TNCV_3445871 [Trichonephila clavipes]
MPRPTTGVLLAPCHDDFRGPRSDYVRQVAFATHTHGASHYLVVNWPPDDGPLRIVQANAATYCLAVKDLWRMATDDLLLYDIAAHTKNFGCMP